MHGLAPLLGLVGLLASNAVVAQETDVIPTAEAVLALTDAGSRMAVPVTVAGSGPFPFIVDTGAERTVISRELAALLKLPQGRDIRLLSMAGTQRVATAQLPAFTINSISGRAIDAPSLFGSNLGAPGMIGIDTLQDKAVVIDFDKRQMSVRPSSKNHGVREQAGDIVIKARSLFGQLVVTQADYGGRTVRVVLDTGSEVSVGNLALQRLMGVHNKGQVTLTSVTGESLPVSYAVAREFTLGGLTIHDLPMGFVDAAPFKRLGLDKQPALMLGMDALRMFRRVSIDFPNRALLFSLPRDARYEPRDPGIRPFG